jgi:hypothetical protein
LDILLLTYFEAFISMLQTFINILKPSVTNVDFKQKQFSSTELFSVSSCNIYNKFRAHAHSMYIKLMKIPEFRNNYDLRLPET